MVASTHDGRAFWILTILDEYTRECLNITVARRITAQEVIHQLAELFIGRGILEHIRSGNGPELRRERSGSGSKSSGTRRCISSLEARGRTDILSRLMES